MYRYYAYTRSRAYFRILTNFVSEGGRQAVEPDVLKAVPNIGAHVCFRSNWKMEERGEIGGRGCE